MLSLLAGAGAALKIYELLMKKGSFVRLGVRAFQLLVPLAMKLTIHSVIMLLMSEQKPQPGRRNASLSTPTKKLMLF